MQPFDYVRAQSISEVLSLLSGRDGQARLLAGGTDLLVQLREGRLRAALLVDIKGIPELCSLTFDSQKGLILGAGVTCYQICRDPNVKDHYPGLVDAVALIGGVQIQTRATLGGNLCNASPAADAIPALIVHEAVCTIDGPNGPWTLPVEQFCTAPGRTVLQSGEILISISLPLPKPNFGAHYLRFIPRNEMDIAEAGAGAAVTLDESGLRITSARVALAAVAPTPLFVPEAGAFLAGKEITAENVQEAARLAQAAARPINDLRGTVEHRKHLCAVLTRRALEKAIERARA
jgi:CO/xanthine dehydrogenase FAD-binding subunit